MPARSIAAGPVRAASTKPLYARPVTQGAIDAAIRRGLDYLYNSQKPDGSWDTRHAKLFAGGVEALVVFTALEAGERPSRRPLLAALKYVAGITPGTVYVRAMRTMVYAHLGAKYARRMQDDVNWLVRYQVRPAGGWGYGPGYPQPRSQLVRTDTSNTALAIMALGEAARAGARVIPSVWKDCLRYLVKYQNADGGWGYDPLTPFHGSSYGSMTAASAASLTIVFDHLAKTGEISKGQIAAGLKAVERAMRWLEKNHSPSVNPKWIWSVPQAELYYYLYSIARVARLTGRRRMGASGWSGPIVAELLKRQRRNGSWVDPALKENSRETPVHTCFALLTLIEARKRVLINCVAVGDERDAVRSVGANLARWIGLRRKRRFAWQVLGAASPSDAFAEAPLLFVDASKASDIPAKIKAKIRRFVLAGGTVIVQAPPGGGLAGLAIQRALASLMSEYSVAVLAKDSPLFNIIWRIAPVNATGISDAARMRIVIFDDDVAAAWRKGFDEKTRPRFELFENILQYALAGKPMPSRFAARKPGKRWREKHNVTVARVRYKGDWSACPNSADRLNDVLAAAIGIGIKEAPPTDLSAPLGRNVAMLWLTGSGPLKLDKTRRRNLKRYLQAGGTILIDPLLGGEKFFDSAAAMLRSLFGKASLRPIDVANPLISGKLAAGLACDVSVVRFLPALRKGPGPPKLLGVEIQGRLAVVLSSYGLTCPLDGTPPIQCKGLAVDDARRLVANVVLYVITHDNGAVK